MEKPKKKRRVLLYSVDSGPASSAGHMCKLMCRKCKGDFGWHHFRTWTEMLKGTPCPVCNKE